MPEKLIPENSVEPNPLLFEEASIYLVYLKINKNNK